MRLMGAMEIFTAQQQEDIKDEVNYWFYDAAKHESLILILKMEEMLKWQTEVMLIHVDFVNIIHLYTS